MKKTVAFGLGVLAVAGAYAAKDPIIMTINGENVPKSEFEYLYNKNSQQQVNPQTLDEYVEMFKLYKMKVADAKASGLDTLASFRKEMEQYRHDLAAPYMADSAYMYRLAEEAYDRSRKEVDAYHIMTFKGRTLESKRQARHLIDSLKQALDNGADFAELATKYSQDRRSAAQGGRMGYIAAGQYPYSFEVVDFALPEGQISDIVESPVGYHILKGGKARPARGKVKVEHILKLTRGKDEAGKAAAKASIDSIYAVVAANPDQFEELAKNLSEDPGSARQGGLLPTFGVGEMVAEFDSVAFAIPVNSISRPFESAFGYHIIKKLEEITPADKGHYIKTQLRAMTSPRDERSKMITRNITDNLASKHKASINRSTLAMMNEAIKANGIDSLFYASWRDGANGNITIAEIDGKKIPARQFVETLKGRKESNVLDASEMIENSLDSFYSDQIIDAEENLLYNTVPDYRNLLKEYTDGSLLYEVSVRKVWDKAAKDEKGLNDYFQAHRDDYKWTEPHVKGLFVQTLNDSVADLIRARVKELQAANQDVITAIRKEFKNQAAIESILIAKGGNPLVDHVAFGGPKVESPLANYKYYFMIDPRILTAPESAEDVKGLVTSDYQNMMQTEWENELRNRYPVKVNQKVLKSVK